MQTQSSQWHQAQRPQASTIRSFDTRKQTTTTHADQPDFSQLAPGESVTFSTAPPKVEERWTVDNRITFQNGGTIEDKENEGGLLITTPDGERVEAHGWVDPDRETGEPVVHFRTKDAYGDMQDWEQTFPSEGGTVIRMEDDDADDTLLSVAPDGSVTGQLDGIIGDKVAAERQGPVLVFDEWSGKTAVSPPVPLDWVLAK